MWIRWLGKSSNDPPSILKRDAFGIRIFQGNQSGEHPGFELFDRNSFVVLLLQLGCRNVPFISEGSS
jgi:hypothetical protein